MALRHVIFNYLKKDALEYEVRIRGEEPATTVAALRKQISVLARDQPSHEILITEEDPAKEATHIRQVLVDLVKEYEGGKLTPSLQALLNHLHYRLLRLSATSAELLNLKEELVDMLVTTEAVFMPDPILSIPSVPALPTQVVATEDTNQMPPIVFAASTCAHSAEPSVRHDAVAKLKLTFNGTASVRAFLERLEELSRARGISHRQLLLAAPELFEGPALHWYRSIANSVDTWECLRALLLEEFDVVDRDYRLLGEIRARSQGRDESVTVYLATMSGFFNCLKLPLSEESKLEILLHNVRPSFTGPLALQEVTSVSQLKALCLRIEGNRERSRFFKEPTSASSDTVEPELAYREARPSTTSKNIKARVSPHGSLMSCRSPAPARAFPSAPASAQCAPDKDVCIRHRSVRFSSESQSSVRRGSSETECKRETPGSISLTTLTVSSASSNAHPSFASMSQSAPSCSTTFGELSELVAPPLPSSTCRFPKLEECAHFHYERVSLGGLRVEMVRGQECDVSATHCGEDTATDSQVAEGWVCLRVRSHINDDSDIETGSALNASWSCESSGEWTLSRNADNFRMLDNMLHRCIYDRKVSGLSDLSRELTLSVIEDRPAYESLIEDYLHHFSIIADDTINCGPILNWLQVDNRGHRLLVANEDSSSINTPAVAAAYSVRKYVSQARDEISFEVGDMISIIDMPGPQESIWWRGKRGFRVGFFPHHCVAVIGDKVPRHMTQPPPIVGSVAVAPIKPVLRKHGKLISLFRSFILSRPSRRTLKQQGILRERVFGCDLGEHLLNSSHDVPLVLMECARVIEAHGAVDGIYRLSGGSGLTQRLRAAFDEGRAPDLTAPPVLQDIHAVASLLKMYFRELPNPLCTYQLYEGFVGAVQPGPEDPTRLRRMRETVVKLPPPHYRTLSYLMRHLRRVSLLGAATGMTARNMAIVWAPNLLRSPRSQHALTGVAVQAVVTEFLICYAEELFSEEQGDSDMSLEHVTMRPGEHKRPKSLPLHPPTKLLSLEEARQRGGLSVCAPGTALMPPPSGAIAAAANTQLRPASHKEPKYIEVGSGPNNLPQYHTVIERPAPGAKRGLKRSPSGWRGLFSLRSKQRVPVRRSIQHCTQPDTQSFIDLPPETAIEKDVTMNESPLRPVKSCESLQSDCEPVAPLSGVGGQGISKQHARSASCDSYFEPWQAELADMRLRLSPQERDGNIFSEEDDTTLTMPAGGAQLSLCSSPGMSEGRSVQPSPRRALYTAPVPPSDAETGDRKRSKLEEQLNSIGYIDGTDSPVRHKPSPEKRHSDEWPARLSQADVAKRLCKDRDSPQSSTTDGFNSSTCNVKLRERSSPRKNRGPSRYSGLHQPLNLPADNDTKIITIVNQIGQPNRVTWHGAKDNHSTLIKIDWPIESANSMTSTLLSSPTTPLTPNYDALESDSEVSEKHTIKVECRSCGDGKKCLKCELTDANDYENVEPNFKIGMPVEPFRETVEKQSLHDSLESSPVTSTNISYQNLNRLSNISTNSSNSDPPKEVSYENVLVPEKVTKTSVMTSSRESSSSYSNVSPLKPADELYECFSFNRPNYINLQSSGSSKSSSTSPLKSPLRSTISITFKSPVKTPNHADYETIETPTNFERDSVYEDIDLEKNLSIVEDATVPEVDASLPTQQACQPESFNEDLIILESPIEQAANDERDMSLDVYSQVKFFRKSIEEVNAMILETPEEKSEKDKPEEVSDYENVVFSENKATYENVSNERESIVEEPILEEPELCIDRRVLEEKIENSNIKPETRNVDSLTQPKLSLPSIEQENGNYSGKSKAVAKNLNVRQLANKFESPTEQKGPFNFDKPYKDVKYPTLERKKESSSIDRAKSLCEARPRKELTLKIPPPISPKTYKLSKNSVNARSLDENAFVKEFGSGRKFGERRKSFEVREIKITKFLPDLNLNTEEEDQSEFTATTPTTENKISLVQACFTKEYKSPTETKSLNFEADKKLSRERIEKYKEERRNFLREKYSSQSFRSSSPADPLMRLKLKRQDENEKPEEVELRNPTERLKEDELPKFERRNTVDLGQRMRFTVNRGVETLSPSRNEAKEARASESSFFERERRTDAPGRSSAPHERKEKISPSYNIKDMAAIFEQKSQSNNS